MARLAYIQDKIVSIEEAQKRIALYKLKNEALVFTNGCFDVLHLGHVRYLAAAADLGKHLIVAINTDDSVRRLGKAPNRPINPNDARATLIAALGFVDLALSPSRTSSNCLFLAFTLSARRQYIPVHGQLLVRLVRLAELGCVLGRVTV